MATPVIPELPPAPTRADGAVDFSTKADALAAAWPPTIVALNASYAWVAQQVSAAEGYKNAASGSANAAANSALAANTAKLAAQQAVTDATNAGAAQVTLAKNQADLSKQHADSAQVYAAAAQSAAGAPSIAGNAYKVLGVNGSATGVAWTWGLPNTALATRGQAVMWGNGQPVWGFPDRIGDIVMSANNPGSLYLPCDGTIRLKAPFPLLAAKLGSLGGKTGADFATQATSVTTGSCVGIAVAPNPVAGGKPYVMQAFSNGFLSLSKDGGSTWQTNSNLNAVGITLNSVTFDPKNKKWIFTFPVLAGNNPRYYELDHEGISGATRTVLGAPDSSAFSKIVCDKNGVWVGIPTVSSRYVYLATGAGSFNNVNWTQIDLGQTITWADIDTDDQGTWVLVGGIYSMISRDGGLTFKSASANLGSGAYSFAANDKKGNWLLGGTGTAAYKRSADNGLNFYAAASPSAAQLGSTGGYSDGFFFFATTAAIYSVPADPGAVSIAGSTSAAYSLMAATNISGMSKVAALDGWVFGAVTTTNNPTVVKSVPSYTYDTASQFALPYLPAPVGLNCYIRALEA